MSELERPLSPSKRLELAYEVDKHHGGGGMAMWEVTLPVAGQMSMLGSSKDWRIFFLSFSPHGDPDTTERCTASISPDGALIALTNTHILGDINPELFFDRALSIGRTAPIDPRTAAFLPIGLDSLKDRVRGVQRQEIQALERTESEQPGIEFIPESDRLAMGRVLYRQIRASLTGYVIGFSRPLSTDSDALIVSRDPEDNEKFRLVFNTGEDDFVISLSRDGMLSLSEPQSGSFIESYFLSECLQRKIVGYAEGTRMAEGLQTLMKIYSDPETDQVSIQERTRLLRSELPGIRRLSQVLGTTAALPLNPDELVSLNTMLCSPIRIQPGRIHYDLVNMSVEILIEPDPDSDGRMLLMLRAFRTSSQLPAPLNLDPLAYSAVETSGERLATLFEPGDMVGEIEFPDLRPGSEYRIVSPF